MVDEVVEINEEATITALPPLSETAGQIETATWLVNNQGSKENPQWKSVKERYDNLRSETPATVTPADPMADMGFVESIQELSIIFPKTNTNSITKCST